MKAPVVLVTAALTLAILLAAAFMIATETRGAETLVPDAVQRSPGDAKHGPVTLRRRARTHRNSCEAWTPDQQGSAAALPCVRERS